jgi:hypothetical protein
MNLVSDSIEGSLYKSKQEIAIQVGMIVYFSNLSQFHVVVECGNFPPAGDLLESSLACL